MDTHEPYEPNLSIGFLFGRSWPLFKENLGLIVGAFFVYLLLTGFLSDPNFFDDERGGVLSIIGFIIAGPLTVGLYALMLRIHRHEPAVFPDLFEGFREFGRAFGVYVLSAIAIGIGMILLIVPGLILAVGLWPALYLVTDDDLGVIDTLKEAWAMTDGHRLRLFGLGVVLFFFMLAGLLVFIVGIVFTGALSTFVAAAAYEELALAEA